MSALAEELRDLAAWADVTSRWLEASARQANDDADPKARTVVFDAAVLDSFLTGFRGVPGLIETAELPRTWNGDPKSGSSQADGDDGLECSPC